MLGSLALLPILSLITTTLAVPSPQVQSGAVFCDDEGLILPTSTFEYKVASGAIDCNSTVGTVSKATVNAGRDITALVTFTYPAAAAGRNCRMDFSLDDNAVVTGSGMLDVFTTWRPAPGCKAGFSQGGGNARDNNIGRLRAIVGQDAAVVAQYGAGLTRPCKAPGTVETFELVGAYDNVFVSWSPRAEEGLVLIVV